MNPGSALASFSLHHERARRPNERALVTVRSYRSAGWAERWQTSWDRLEERYVPDRELRLPRSLDITEAVVGVAPTVVDLGCGTGTITRRLLRRFPEATSIAVDIDPVLLTIASATFHDDARVRVEAADLRDPDWVGVLRGSRVDAALTATALHWLPEGVVRRLYRDLSGVVREGGVVAHAELMPLRELPVSRRDDGVRPYASERQRRLGSRGLGRLVERCGQGPRTQGRGGRAAQHLCGELSNRGVLTSS